MTTPRHVTTRRELRALSTQSRHPWRATVRTILAMIIPLAAAAPEVYAAITAGDPRMASGIAGGVLVVAGAITRLIAVPTVDDALRSIGLGSTPRD